VAGGDSALAEAFDAIATRITDDVAPVVEVAGCTAHMLEHVEAALGDA
jgi:hypothetical protein